MGQAFQLQDDKGPPSFLISRTLPAAAVVVPELAYTLHIRKYIRHIVAQEKGHEHSSRLHQAMKDAIENALSGLFITETTGKECELKNAPYKCIMAVLADMAEKGALDKTCGRSIDHWTQSTVVMDVFSGRVPEFLRLRRPVTQFIKTNMDGTIREQWIIAMSKEILPADVGASGLQLFSLSSSVNDNNVSQRKRRQDG